MRFASVATREALAVVTCIKVVVVVLGFSRDVVLKPSIKGVEGKTVAERDRGSSCFNLPW